MFELLHCNACISVNERQFVTKNELSMNEQMTAMILYDCEYVHYECECDCGYVEHIRCRILTQ